MTKEVKFNIHFDKDYSSNWMTYKDLKYLQNYFKYFNVQTSNTIKDSLSFDTNIIFSNDKETYMFPSLYHINKDFSKPYSYDFLGYILFLIYIHVINSTSFKCDSSIVIYNSNTNEYSLYPFHIYEKKNQLIKDINNQFNNMSKKLHHDYSDSLSLVFKAINKMMGISFIDIFMNWTEFPDKEN